MNIKKILVLVNGMWQEYKEGMQDIKQVYVEETMTIKEVKENYPEAYERYISKK